MLSPLKTSVGEGSKQGLKRSCRDLAVPYLVSHNHAWVFRLLQEDIGHLTSLEILQMLLPDSR